MMRRIRQTMAFVTALASASLCVHAGALRWVQSVQEFQVGLLDESVTAVFAFTNASDRLVTIRDVKTSCGCTAAQPDKTTYAPGEGGEIRAVFTLGGRVGTQVKQVNVLTSDPAEPVKVLTLRVQIPELLRADRLMVMWGIGDERTPERVSLRAMSDADVELIGVQVSDATFRATIEEVEKGRRFDLVVEPVSTEAPFYARVQVDAKPVGHAAQRSYVVFCRVLRKAP